MTRAKFSLRYNVNLLSTHEILHLAWSGGVHENQALVKKCYLVAHQAKPSNAFLVKGIDAKDELIEERGEPTEDLMAIS